jgi:hypothetical protein
MIGYFPQVHVPTVKISESYCRQKEKKNSGKNRGGLAIHCGNAAIAARLFFLRMNGFFLRMLGILKIFSENLRFF